jgi:S1-C subfamily serine protease
MLANIDESIFVVVSNSNSIENCDPKIGTGFLAHGYVITCYHVTGDKATRNIQVFKKDGTEVNLDLSTSVFYRDRDLALLKTNLAPSSGLSVLTNKNTLSVNLSTSVYTKGYSSVDLINDFTFKPIYVKPFKPSRVPFQITRQLQGTIASPDGKSLGIYVGTDGVYVTTPQTHIYVKNCSWTGGLSGSPVLTANNDLIGIAYYSFFDSRVAAENYKNEAVAIHCCELYSILKSLGAVP